MEGQPLSVWLHAVDPDDYWIPNDVYGHIHDELWVRLIGPSEVSGTTTDGTRNPWSAIWSQGTQVRLGTHTLPWLIRWMETRPTGWDRVAGSISRWLPASLARHVYPYSEMAWGSRATRWHIAAFRGLSLMGTNAEPALPALSQLLARDDADLPLTWAIAQIGPSGVAVLTRELSGTTVERRDRAALALGLEYKESAGAMPALVECVERGEVSYHVLGAIGRIGGTDARLVPALIRWLESTNAPAHGTMGADMALLLLGLQRDGARAAAPFVIRQHRAACLSGTDAERRLLRRVLLHISPDDMGKLPPAQAGEESDDWP